MKSPLTLQKCFGVVCVSVKCRGGTCPCRRAHRWAGSLCQHRSIKSASAGGQLSGMVGRSPLWVTCKMTTQWEGAAGRVR